MYRLLIKLALLSCTIITFFAIRAIVIESIKLSDVCVQWNAGNSASNTQNLHSLNGAPASGCPTVREVTSETKSRAIVQLGLVAGGLLTAVCLGILGTVTRNFTLTTFGAVLMIVETVPAFSLAPVTLLTSAIFFGLAVSQKKLLPNYRFQH